LSGVRDKKRAFETNKVLETVKAVGVNKEGEMHWSVKK
jgi:hypothetical protein